MLNEGWIKLFRKTEDNPVICKDNDYFRLWCHLLLNATHKQTYTFFNGSKILLQPGQYITGRKQIANKCKISESKVERILKMLEIEQQIEQRKFSTGRLITILNWEMYQESEQQNEQRVNNEWTASEQRVNTKQEYKECKNVRSKEEIYKEESKISSKYFVKPTLEEVTEYCNERKNKVNPQRFIDFYESKGWMIGKNHMKDWKSAIRNWEKPEASPDWFNKKIEKEQINDKELKELEEMLKGFK